MVMNIPSLALEIGLGILLVAALIYSVRLDRKLHAMRDGQSELAQIVREFHQAASRAESGVRTLKLASEQAGAELDQQIFKARALCDELRLLTELGEARASRIAMTPVMPGPSISAPSIVTSDAFPASSESAGSKAAPSASVAQVGLDGDDLFEQTGRKTEADWLGVLKAMR
jgi:hypothetical protein